LRQACRRLRFANRADAPQLGRGKSFKKSYPERALAQRIGYGHSRTTACPANRRDAGPLKTCVRQCSQAVVEQDAAPTVTAAVSPGEMCHSMMVASPAGPVAGDPVGAENLVTSVDLVLRSRVRSSRSSSCATRSPCSTAITPSSEPPIGVTHSKRGTTMSQDALQQIGIARQLAPVTHGKGPRRVHPAPGSAPARQRQAGASPAAAQPRRESLAWPTAFCAKPGGVPSCGCLLGPQCLYRSVAADNANPGRQNQGTRRRTGCGARLRPGSAWAARANSQAWQPSILAVCRFPDAPISSAPHPHALGSPVRL
jgi:hypothetical protein